VWLAIVAWALTGLGMGLVYPSLSVLTLALSTPEQQGRNTSALHLSEAIAVATTLAVSGSLFAFLLTQSERAAYMACFIAPIGLVLLSVLVARRVQDTR
jgi:MFS family permease